MKIKTIQTDNAPQAIGPYSQARQIGNLLFISGQIALDPQTMLLADDFNAQARQVFANISAICTQAGATFADIVKLNISLANLEDFSSLNNIMTELFSAPYPARAALAVKALPLGALLEIEAIVAV